MAETLKGKTAKGLLWGGMNNAVQQMIGLVFGIILGRLLSRNDFGMIAMITIFSVIANELQSSGFKTGLINMKTPRHEDYNSVFWFNIIAGSTIYILLFFMSPLIAAYYHQPALTWLCRYVFLGFVFSSFGLAQSAYLTKNLQIKQIALSGMIAILLSSVTGATMAWQGFAYWALATQSLVYILTNTLLLWYFSPWRPTFDFSFEPIKRLFPFSVSILITAILSHINVNVMNIMLGRYYSARDTGDYNQAYQWNSKLFLLIQNMVKQVDQPVLVGLHNERERQLHVFRKMMRFTAFISFPLLFGLGLVSHEFIIITIGEKWAISAALLPLLCLSGAFMPLSTLLADMIITRGRGNIYMWVTFLLGICEIILILTLWPYGIRTMVWAFVIVNILWVGVWFFFVNRLIEYRLLSFLKDVLPFALTAFCVMVVTYMVTQNLTSLWILLFCRIAIAVTLYYLIMRLAQVRILFECQQFVISKFKKA